jgi:hypothetical protein
MCVWRHGRIETMGQSMCQSGRVGLRPYEIGRLSGIGTGGLIALEDLDRTKAKAKAKAKGRY